MKRKIYSFIALVALMLFVGISSASAADMWWGNYSDQTQSITGNYKLGSYEAAMFVAGDGSLKGNTINSVRFRSRLYSNAKDVKVWVRSALDGTNIAEAVVATPGKSSTEWSEASFATPVAIPAEGVYVGYSFTLSNWYSDYDYTPIVYAKVSADKSFYLKQPDETTFSDLSSSKGALALQINVSAPAAEMYWGNYADQAQSITGNYKLGDYQAAMFVDGSGSLAGTSITGFRFRSRLYSNAKDVKIWVRSALDGDNLAEAVVENPAKSGTEWSEASFATPVAVPAEGVYVGYSFTLANWYSDYDYTPIVYAKVAADKGFYLMQPEETTFTDKSSTGVLAAQVKLSGSSMASNAAQIKDDLDDVMSLVGQPVKVTVNLVNLGGEGINSIGYTYTMNGKTNEGELTLATPIANMFNAPGTATLELVAPEQAGSQDVEIKLTKINGATNENTKKVKATVTIVAMDKSAERNTLLEVYVDKSKYYSGRAYVGVENLKKSAIGKNIIPMIIHRTDQLAVEAYKTRAGDTRFYSNFADVDRSFVTDPYYGDAKSGPYHFTADATIQPATEVLSEAAVTVAAQWTDATKTAVKIDAATTFQMDYNNAHYRLAFAVLKDNITFDQTNYVSYYKTQYPDDDMAAWREAPYNTTAVNNDLVVAATDPSGVEKSVPVKVKGGEAIACTQELAVPATVNELGEDLGGDNARVVAYLVNTYTHAITNAAICTVTDASAAGISTADVTAPVEVYTIDGVKVGTASAPGLYIVKQGKSVKKVMVK